MDENTYVSLVVFDWAGTTVDYASSAPADVFMTVFTDAGINLTRDEINGPMGMEKKKHIRSLLSLETARNQWKKKYGREWNESDIDLLYQTFEEKLLDVVMNYSTPIDGVVETVKELRKRGIGIGSTTGYNAQIMEKVIPVASKYGYEPDCVITPDDTGVGRPAPFMLFECMKTMNVYPANRVVKVGDTIADIAEGKNAGAWCIGVLTGSNLLGISREEADRMSKTELDILKKETTKKYIAAGADMVIDSISELPQVIDNINRIINGTNKEN